MVEALLKAARAYPDIMVTGDNVIGDFHIHLPFNQHLWRAAQTNPVQVCFDLYGEYWGRSFFPTSALSQYEEHLAIARRMGAQWVNGRISTGHDKATRQPDDEWRIAEIISAWHDLIKNEMPG